MAMRPSSVRWFAIVSMKISSQIEIDGLMDDVCGWERDHVDTLASNSIQTLIFLTGRPSSMRAGRFLVCKDARWTLLWLLSSSCCLAPPVLSLRGVLRTSRNVCRRSTSRLRLFQEPSVPSLRTICCNSRKYEQQLFSSSLGGISSPPGTVSVTLLRNSTERDEDPLSDHTAASEAIIQEAKEERKVKHEDNGTNFPPTPSFRECLEFAIPTLGIYTCPPLMSLIDASFIGRWRNSVSELAALGPGGSIADSAPLPLLFLSIAATNLMASSSMSPNDLAVHQKAKCGRISRVTLLLGATGGSILGMLLYATAYPLATWYCGTASADALLANHCARYVTIRALAIPAAVVTTIAQAVCIGLKDSKTPMYAVVLAGILNLLGDFLTVRQWGVAGVAWATTVSQYAAMGLLLFVLQRRGLLDRTAAAEAANRAAAAAVATQDTDVPSVKDIILSLLRFVPFLYVMGVKMFMHNSCAATAVSLGKVPAAAHTALIAVGMLCFTFGDAAASMAQAYLPAFENKKTGKYDLEAALPTLRQLVRCTWSISSTVVVLSTTLLTVFGNKITTNAAVLAEMRRVIPIMSATLAVHGTAVTLEGLLLSRKLFRPLTLTYTGIAVSIALWMMTVRSLGAGLVGVWGCYIWFSSSRIVAFAGMGGLFRPLSRSVARKWKTLLPNP